MYFGWILVVFAAWSFLQIWVVMEPKLVYATVTDWYIFINENVAILPCDLYGRHREDGSGWTVATMGDAEVRALPAYIPAWDATPAPEYCPDTSISIPLQEKQ
ncbi:hypothetical protein BCR33DRAFT_713326 [Rhizoclosmatium globosum]|uniref:Uncharacterized protein n=1 Tax=Rhizoclosmatium globosum TaxID=329046 RepID=A0A1Y2CU51_9FUNG|nr:hypothetical protein BCR33DRAFT_713326 [Rhizoclosmatium globosum]|eukprot:ORY50553.1 hypothetical protein BCR33DRAFT_713326 [Rhizoclosmatium globosum]